MYVNIMVMIIVIILKVHSARRVLGCDGLEMCETWLPWENWIHINVMHNYQCARYCLVWGNAYWLTTPMCAPDHCRRKVQTFCESTQRARPDALRNSRNVHYRARIPYCSIESGRWLSIRVRSHCWLVNIGDGHTATHDIACLCLPLFASFCLRANEVFLVLFVIPIRR